MSSVLVRILLAMTTAPLLALAQPPYDLAPLALVALVPWLLAVRRSGLIEAVCASAVAGTLYGFLAAAWLADAFESLGSTGLTAIAGHVWTVAWAKLALFASVGFVAWAVRDRSAGVQLLAVATAFGLGEAFHLSWHLGLPFVLLGHSQLPVLGVAQLATVAGVPLVTAFVTAINVSVALSISGVARGRAWAAALLAAWFGAASVGVRWAEFVRSPEPGRPSVRLLLIQPDLPHRLRWVARLQRDHLETTAAYTDAALDDIGSDVDAVVWPENLLTFPIDRATDLQGVLRQHVSAWGVPLIGGFARSAPGSPRDHYRSSILWWQPEEPEIFDIDKVRAIPLLESSAEFSGSRAMGSLYGRATRWPKVVEALETGPLEGPIPLTVALCYEVLFPKVVKARHTPDSRAILNLADDSWVAGDTASQQLLAAATFRAIEMRKPLVRVAHGGISRVVDPFGRTVMELPEGEWAHAVVKLEPSAPPGLAERGFILPLPLATGAGVWWLATLWMRRGRREPR